MGTYPLWLVTKQESMKRMSNELSLFWGWEGIDPTLNLLGHRSYDRFLVPNIANPKLMLLGAAAQIGVFGTFQELCI